MKALLLTLDFPPNRPGGMANYFAGLAAHMPPDEIVVLTGKGRQAQLGEAFPVYRAPMRSGGWVTVPIWFVLAARIVIRERISLVICGNVSPYRHVALALRAMFGTPYVLHFFGNDLLRLHRRMARSSLSRMLGGFAVSRAALVVACSRFTADAAVESLRVPAEKVVVTYPGLDRTLLDREVPPPTLARGQPLRVVSVGRLTSRKGFDTVIRAIGLLQESAEPVAVQYTLVGTGDQGPLRSLAEQVGVSASVRFAGYLPNRTDVEAQILAAHVLAMPSRMAGAGTDVEGFGMVYLEAAALQRPSVAGGSGGAPEAVVDGQGGIVVGNPESVQEVADALRRFAADGAFLLKCAQNAWIRANRDFTWTSIVDALRPRLAAAARQVRH
jgi:phosphatidyl-myo-inositol dimannoside synthase